MLRRSQVWIVLACSVWIAVGSGSAWASQTEGDNFDRGTDQLEEVVIRADRPAEVQLEERRRMQQLRQQLLEEFSRNQLLQKRDNVREQQRQLERSSSINLGFDAKRDRQNFHLAGGNRLPWSDITPASFISVSF